MKIRNTFIIFIVSGFWHGANWTFVAWGALNALYFLPLLLTNNNRLHLDVIAQGRWLPTFKEGGKMLLTFLLTVVAWIFFRAEDLPHALSYLGEIFSPSLFTWPAKSALAHITTTPVTMLFLLGLFTSLEWIGREHQFAIEKIGLCWPKTLRWTFYLLIGMILFAYGNFNKTEFIYFAF